MDTCGYIATAIFHTPDLPPPMKEPVNPSPTDNSGTTPTPTGVFPASSRRQFLAGLALAGAASLLAGCQSQQQFLPGPVYPDMDPEAGESPVTVRVYQPPTPGGTAPQGTWTPPKSNPIPSGVIARSNWTKSAAVVALADPMNGVNRITVHHDALVSTSISSQSEAANRLEQVRRSHRSNNWADIGYHYIIDPQGRIWEGRPIWLQGAHVKDTNEHNIGVMCMGNFEVHSPTSAQLNSLDNFVGSLCRTHRIAIGRVFTHRELKPTLCPGRNLQRYMAQTRASGGRLARMA